ncbi:hypothetical protein ACIB24_12520 [Spongisporangium articulatum]|uniref:Uncharacterized protein n=1 Tax=Spongisporangium articulatum TaxID=3362603 RepID=A0ABW8APH7_9ACTN
MVTYGLPIETDPGDALLQLVALSAGHVAWLAQEIRQLAPEALTWGASRRSHEAGYNSEGRVDVTTEIEASGINVLLEIYHRERDLLRRTATDAARLGIAKKKLELAEQAGERAGEFLRLALAPLRLPQDQIREVIRAGAPHLHLLAGGFSAG